MTMRRMLRLWILLVAWLPPTAHAVSQVQISVGQLDVAGAKVEKLSAVLDMSGRWQGSATLAPSAISELAKGQPLPVTFTQGVLKGKAAFAGEGQGLRQFHADLDLHDAAFSDAEGLHAGEKVGATLALEGTRSGEAWAWTSNLRWTAGEVFWQPFYLAQGGLSFQGSGTWSDSLFAISAGRVALREVGQVEMSAEWRRPGNALQSMTLNARDVEMGQAYPLLLKPMLEKTLLGNLEMAGQADIAARWEGGALSRFDVRLRAFDVADREGRFALYKVNASVPWALNHPTQAGLHYDGGHVLNLPLGMTDLAATLNGYSLTSPLMRLPILDGELTLKDVSAAFLQKQWHWHLGASLSPVSMADFSHAVGWPVMQGKVAAVIPMVTYSNGRMMADGAMGFDVFDGSVVVRNLVLENPLGLAPRLQAELQMRNLDLELLTRTYSFGAMTGRLDGDVKQMELSRWQPVKFDADFHSSPGSYPKKISQRAVENISALGGAGAAAAIQRSFLRFFKEFNYAKIGLSCKLRNGVCAMDGVESTHSGYVIVKGSGIPAITVLGYNRSVSWGELLGRIKRVTQGNASPVIK